MGPSGTTVVFSPHESEVSVKAEPARYWIETVRVSRETCPDSSVTSSSIL